MEEWMDKWMYGWIYEHTHTHTHTHRYIHTDTHIHHTHNTINKCMDRLIDIFDDWMYASLNVFIDEYVDG